MVSVGIDGYYGVRLEQKHMGRQAKGKLGLLIKRQRELKGLSQRALSTKAGLGTATVGKIETGQFQRSGPDLPTLGAIADALGIPRQDLIDAALEDRAFPTKSKAHLTQSTIQQLTGLTPEERQAAKELLDRLDRADQ